MLGFFPLSSHPLSDVAIVREVSVSQTTPSPAQSLIGGVVLAGNVTQVLPDLIHFGTNVVHNYITDPVDGINFLIYTGKDIEIDGSGYALGFYGPEGRLDNVEVGDWQASTFLVDKGVTEGEVQARNTTFLTSTTANTDGGPVNLRNIPNFLATLNVRFIHPTEVFVAAATARFYDGADTNNPPDGLDIKVAEIRHPGLLLNDSSGGGYKEWEDVGDGSSFSLVQSPGRRGVKSNSSQYWISEESDWYVAISVSPQSIGSRTFGLTIQVEYI